MLYCYMEHIVSFRSWYTVESGQVLLEIPLYKAFNASNWLFSELKGSMLWLQHPSLVLLTEFQYIKFGMRNTSLSTAKQRSSTDGQMSDTSKLREANVSDENTFYQMAHFRPKFSSDRVFIEEKKDSFFSCYTNSKDGLCFYNYEWSTNCDQQINMEFNAIE